MNWRQLTILLLGIFSVTVFYFQLPETPNPFELFGCKTCRAKDPYIPLVAAGYFAGLTSFCLLCPAVFTPVVARAGLLWAILLALALTYIKLPYWCVPCLMTHSCHVLIWSILLFFPMSRKTESSRLPERFCLALTLAIAVVALFGALNLTSMAYQAKANQKMGSATDLKVQDLSRKVKLLADIMIT